MIIIVRRVKYLPKGKQQTCPVKDKKQMEEILYYLLSKRDKAKQKGRMGRYWQYDRNYMLVLVGFNTAFRAEDLLQLRVKDIITGGMHIKENKTGKCQIFNIGIKLLNDVRDYVERNGYTDYDYMFPSQRSDGVIKAITRQQADRIMKDIKHNLNITYCFGMHSLRKTFGYQKYNDTRNIMTIMKMYNHASPDVTMCYIMWDMNDVEKTREDTYFGVEGKSKTKVNKSKKKEGSNNETK